MNEEEIRKAIFDTLKKIAPDTEPEKLKLNENIKRTLDIDSFDALQFIVGLKKSIGIDIPEEDYGKTDTMENLMNYIKEKIKQ